ncbi:ribose-phosphate pyrophosphokinase [Sphingomonas lenta]|uniref:Ribose-phosphate pyrophosphokinase n=2 Tax=Sphingomonas lenta TaxID=1141887 RepID=A0A2A2SHT9_9SPHN|nr:ribose-phosphate pyrophosphokinase [Sphingomonas lenta]PAX08730.1 ribose-phosphate pyrophosphokinase [Sphingomonas lenta]
MPAATSPAETSPIADVALVRSLLVEAARAGESVSYSRFLNQLGLPFSRPKMRALCRTLDRIDQEGELRGEPGLAVLVVRDSDGLPGQGWWAGWRAEELGWGGDWTGPAARAFVEEHQRAAFDWWRDR